MGNNPWNTTMSIEFDEAHKKRLVEFYERINNNHRKKKLKDRLKYFDVPLDSKYYLKGKYEEGYGLKVLARALDLTYTRIRTLFRYMDLEHRKGRDIVTDKVKVFRSERVKGDKNPWKDWTEKYPKMHKSCSRGIQGYYKRKNGAFVYLRSSWEYIFAKWLDKNNIDWKYEYKQYKLSNGEGYRPDFFIFKNDKLKIIVEIKGYYKDRVHKVDMFRNEYPHIKIIKISNIGSYTPYTEKKERDEWYKNVKLLERKSNR